MDRPSYDSDEFAFAPPSKPVANPSYERVALLVPYAKMADALRAAGYVVGERGSKVGVCALAKRAVALLRALADALVRSTGACCGCERLFGKCVPMTEHDPECELAAVIRELEEVAGG